MMVSITHKARYHANADRSDISWHWSSSRLCRSSASRHPLL